MSEDPDLSRRRIEHQQLRKQLNEVFGPFEQFCEYVAATTNAGSSGIMRHGVVQIPTTSAVLSTQSVMPLASGQTPVTTNQHSSTQQLLQSMQNLVTSPIRPIQELSFSFNREHHSSLASSSTRNAVETSESSTKLKRHRAQDSDSEFERDKRKRRNEDFPGLPGTSRSNAHPLFSSESRQMVFEDGAERKELRDKGISPDSGIHSTENDPGDENDIHSTQTIINLITKLSPPLSPIKQRPSDKKAERERRELEIKERQRKKHYELERKDEEERERLEKEQAESDERLKNERSENEKIERDREERLRRHKEREEREHQARDQENKEREDKDRKGKEREYRLKREPEVEEKHRDQKECEEQLRREKEREMRKQRVVEESPVGEKKPKESVRRDGHEGVEKMKNGSAERMKLKGSNESFGERLSRLDGEIILKGLDRSRLSQLIEIGRKMGRTKEDRKENVESAAERRKEKKEREKLTYNKHGVDDMDVQRRERTSSARSSPCIPRASSSQSHDGGDQANLRPSSTMSTHSLRPAFECAASECAPTKPARPVKPKEDSTEMFVRLLSISCEVPKA
ncbi:hypothetical protein KIN20_025889 [Parelaphostrongylus tenuis]|uniref:Uncharacterized protein n=1 Tax=Parelaphostrongylus tenuis TaxID=148309 RepID=A0AAD5MYX7_PARTN|nr:hypothetical protein KIN20_025889 [Parelaphostrongylus tenuis]